MKNQVSYFSNSVSVYFLHYSIDNHELAISLYKQGIQELERAVNLSIDPHGKKQKVQK